MAAHAAKSVFKRAAGHCRRKEASQTTETKRRRSLVSAADGEREGKRERAQRSMNNADWELRRAKNAMGGGRRRRTYAAAALSRADTPTAT